MERNKHRNVGNENIMKLKLNTNVLLNILIIVPLIKPVGLTYQNPAINTMLQYWKLLSILMITLVLLTHLRQLAGLFSGKSIYRKGIIGLLIFECIYLFNTISRSVEFSDLLNNCLTCILLLIYIPIARKNRRKESFNKSLDFVFTIYIICQIVSMVLERLSIIWLKAEDGSPTYFFGPDNYSAFLVIPMLGVLLYLGCKGSEKIEFRKKDLILLGSLTVCYIWTGSVTAACALIILVVASMFIGNNKKAARIFSIKGLLFVFGLVLFLILTINIQDYFLSILKLVGKGDSGFSLNSRTYIWAQALQLIKQYPLLGIGNLSESEIASYVLYGASHAHNIILELLLRTGITGTISYLHFLIYPLIKYRRYYLRSKDVILLIAGYVYLVMSFMDFYPLIQAPIFLVSLIYSCADDMKNSVCAGKN